MMLTAALHWPCIVKLCGVDELIWIGDVTQLRAELEGLIVSADDSLIDSQGNCFALKALQEIVWPRSPSANVRVFDDSLALSDLALPVLAKLEAGTMSALVQKHQCSLGHTCTAKVHFSSVGAAIAALA